LKSGSGRAVKIKRFYKRNQLSKVQKFVRDLIAEVQRTEVIQYQAIEFEKHLKSGSGRAVMNKRFFKRAQ